MITASVNNGKFVLDTEEGDEIPNYIEVELTNDITADLRSIRAELEDLLFVRTLMPRVEKHERKKVKEGRG